MILPPLSISENLSWIFNGIGTQIICSIISLIAGFIAGGTIGYKIGTKNRTKQSQKAGGNAMQQQIGSVNIYHETEQKQAKGRK